MRNQSSIFGHIETSYKQSEIIRAVDEIFGVRTQVTDSGVCMAMSAKYLAKSSQGEKFYSWLSDSSAKWHVMSLYLDNDYRALPPVDAQARIQDDLKEVLNHVGTYQLKRRNFTSYAVAQAMSLARNDGKVSYNMCYLLMPNDGPGHAVACIKNEFGQVRFMDPNFGELSFYSASEFENWMIKVFHKHYFHFSHMVVNYYEVPI